MLCALYIGLDSSTAFDIIRSARDICHILGMTSLISLLQPPPEVYDLFDEIMLLSEGQIIFHGTSILNNICNKLSIDTYECVQVLMKM
jgi:ABC-type multidrug transport system ATPase subunit